jgi:transcriptional regulator CtsR
VKVKFTRLKGSNFKALSSLIVFATRNNIIKVKKGQGLVTTIIRGDFSFMPNISELIEQYIKQLLQKSQEDQIELQRNELAAKFKCVPSQINYVLSTRFSVENGYVVESRRGGGGYIRIVRIPLDRDEDPTVQIYRLVGEDINQAQSDMLVKRLYEEGFITAREAVIFRAALDRNTLQIDLPWRDNLRAQLLRAMLLAVLRES